MKPWHAIIGMVGILLLVCAPVVADMLIPMDYFMDYDLSINSDPPGANVYLDYQYQGTTPLTISVSGHHWHHIVLTMQGYRIYDTSVYIRNGETSTVSATLTPIQILPSGYVSSNSEYLPTPTPPIIYRSGPRSALDVYLMLKALLNVPMI